MTAARKEDGGGEGRRGKDCSWTEVQIIYEPYSVLHCEYLPTGVRDTMCRAGAGAGSKGTGVHFGNLRFGGLPRTELAELVLNGA